MTVSKKSILDVKLQKADDSCDQPDSSELAIARKGGLLWIRWWLMPCLNDIPFSQQMLSEKPRKCSISAEASPPLARLTPSDLETAVLKIAKSVQPWKTGKYTSVKNLQEAPRSHGRVDMMKGAEGSVAVKVMPNWWLKRGPDEFKAAHPHETEYPWHDMGLLAALNTVKFPYVCEFHGVCRDNISTYIVTSLATEGDLFAWSGSAPKAGKDRESMMRAIMTQVLVGMRTLHDIGVAHRDISLENILLTKGSGGETQVKIIDYSMAAIAQHGSGCKYGKTAYKSPEMFQRGSYDLFLADAFALGVVHYAMAWQRYPWKSTQPGKDEAFTHAKNHGLASLEQVRNKQTKDTRSAYSSAMYKMMEGLLAMDPTKRLNLGESCFHKEPDRSIWATHWL